MVPSWWGISGSCREGFGGVLSVIVPDLFGLRWAFAFGRCLVNFV